MTDSGTLPFAEIPRGPIEAAARTAMDYSVSLIHDMRQIGSGTLVEVDGSFGILTAHHVADLFAAPNSTPLGLNIALEPHAFFLPRSTLEIVTIGKAADVRGLDDYTEHGPDLAFVRISDLNHLGTIKSKKSFCPLMRRPFAPYADHPLHELMWLVAGAPSEHNRPSGELGTPSYRLGVGHLFAAAQCIGREAREEFDYLTIAAVRGEDNYPMRYDGVSGGGVWLVPLAMDERVGPSSLGTPGPIFAGVFYYERFVEQGTQLLAHGLTSIYSDRTLGLIAGQQVEET